MDITNLKNDIQLQKEMNNWNVRDDLKGKTVEEIRENQPKNHFSVGFVNIDGGLNIGSMIRSATIFGADKVFLIGRKRYDKRSTVGAHNYIDIDYVECDPTTELGSDQLINYIYENNYNPIAIEQGGRNIDDYRAGVYPPVMSQLFRPCFLFGSEGEGLPSLVTSKAASVYAIKQFGVMRSLNVSAAAAIVMYEYMRKL
jgi:tRNA G18 (ribose-2'-O)-methylase SpoU